MTSGKDPVYQPDWGSVDRTNRHRHCESADYRPCSGSVYSMSAWAAGCFVSSFPVSSRQSYLDKKEKMEYKIFSIGMKPAREHRSVLFVKCIWSLIVYYEGMRFL